MKFEFVKDSIFEADKYQVELLFISFPGSLKYPMNMQAKRYIEENAEQMSEQNWPPLKLFKNKNINDKYIKYILFHEIALYRVTDAWMLVKRLINISSYLGVKSLAMNGIRIEDSRWENNGRHERELIELIIDVSRNSNEQPLKKIVLIDKKGGFNSQNLSYYNRKII